MILTRILYDLLILIAIFLLPWWLIIATCLLLAFYFEFYFEFVLFSLIFDLIYAPISLFLGVYYLTIVTLLFFVVVEFLKRRVILIDSKPPHQNLWCGGKDR